MSKYTYKDAEFEKCYIDCDDDCDQSCYESAYDYLRYTAEVKRYDESGNHVYTETNMYMQEWALSNYDIVVDREIMYLERQIIVTKKTRIVDPSFPTSITELFDVKNRLRVTIILRELMDEDFEDD